VGLGKGRDADFTAYVAARRPHLRRTAYLLCGDWHQAEDLVQTALAKLYVAWPRVRRDGSPEAYARKILVRSHLDETRRPWRRERSSSQLLEPSGGGSPQPAPEGDCEAVPAPMPEMPELTRIEAARTDVLDPTGDHLTSFLAGIAASAQRPGSDPEKPQVSSASVTGDWTGGQREHQRRGPRRGRVRYGRT